MRPRRCFALRGTSLVELAVAGAVVVALVLLMFEVFEASAGALGRAQRRAEAFRTARLAAALMARDLASVCRSPLSTNLVIAATGPEGGASVCALTVPPGGRGEVAAVGYHCAWKPGRQAFALVRTFLPPGRTLERLRRGEDPFAGAKEPAASTEELAPCLWDLRITAISAEGREFEPGTAFSSHPPARIDLAFRVLSRDLLPSIAARKPSMSAWLEPPPGDALAAEAIEVRTSIALP